MSQRSNLRTRGDGDDITLDTTNFDGILGPGDTDVQTAMETIDDYSATGDAVDITLDTTDFDGILGPGDTDVQTAMETIDDYTPPGGGLIWEVITSSQTAEIEHGYISNSSGTIVITLPATFTIGDTIKFSKRGSGDWRVVPATGDSLYWGANVAHDDDYIYSDGAKSAMEIVCVEENAVWNALWWNNVDYGT